MVNKNLSFKITTNANLQNNWNQFQKLDFVIYNHNYNFQSIIVNYLLMYNSYKYIYNNYKSIIIVSFFNVHFYSIYDFYIFVFHNENKTKNWFRIKSLYKEKYASSHIFFRASHVML